MSRIEDAVFQDEVATSLLGPEQPEQQAEETQSEYAVSGADLLTEAAEEQTIDTIRDGDEETQNRRGQRPDESEGRPGEREPREKPADQESPEQPATAQQIEEGIAALDATVEQYGLNDSASAKEFASGFAEVLNTDIYKSGFDVQQIGNAMAKTTVSVLQAYEASGGDISKIGQIPAEAARAYSYEVLRGMGIDPRTVNVDERQLADIAFRGTWNFLDTFNRYGGKVTEMSKLNDPVAAEMFLGGFLKAFVGEDVPVSREQALKFADTCGTYILNKIGQLRDIQARNASQEKQPRGRARGQRVPAAYREGIKGSKAPRFKSNQDVFDGPTMDYYHHQHGRL